jgi:hypothetical protein
MTRDATLEKYLPIVRRIENYFKGFTVEYVERAKNTEVEDWRAQIMAYLRHHYESDNNIELLRMQQRANACQVIED